MFTLEALGFLKSEIERLSKSKGASKVGGSKKQIKKTMKAIL